MRPIRVQYELQQTSEGQFYAVRREFYRWGGRSSLVPGSVGHLARAMSAIKRDCRTAVCDLDGPGRKGAMAD